ncbi:Hemk methyltransferase family member 2-like [Mycena indigotica]|uniref:Hemk methyltransferase family member 2-like n=1 Tax=Mycena indigotica TaxID=2126181 RepID=A0A8H6SXG0_9AGAR|nr:Hemk methyltransferase family member 2-like [Mycena indigotica]KAF7306592.1 Hemk methyltransferase family member 2-like [Mycena indigotica]
MIPTPDLSHLKASDYETVYEPAEDTFILLDALESDSDTLKQLRPRLCLEIGSGSGCVSTFLGSILGSSEALFLCTDINPHACSCSVATGLQNKIPLNLVNASLADPLLWRLQNAVDIIIFNPPYVPTVADEAWTAQADRGIGGAWAGGKDGMEITNVFLPHVSALLAPGGHFYLVAVTQNNIVAMQQRMKDIYGLESQVVLRRRAGGEHLSVIRFSKTLAVKTAVFHSNTSNNEVL